MSVATENKWTFQDRAARELNILRLKIAPLAQCRDAIERMQSAIVMGLKKQGEGFEEMKSHLDRLFTGFSLGPKHLGFPLLFRVSNDVEALELSQVLDGLLELETNWLTDTAPDAWNGGRSCYPYLTTWQGNSDDRQPMAIGIIYSESR